MNPTARKVFTFVLVLILGIIFGVSVSFYAAVKFSAAPTKGTVAVPGLSNEVQITFDAMGIPQIWAVTEADALYALGYQHAADRMFQMDLVRRLSQGRLSEMLGQSTADLDRDQRRIGHRRMARKVLETLSETNRSRLQAYCDGVNAYKRTCRALPFEFRFLPVDFEDWTVLDCIALYSFQTWFSNALMTRDEFYVELARVIGTERIRSLMFPYPEWAPTTLPTPSSLGAIPFDNDEEPTHSHLSFQSPVTPEPHTRSVYGPFQRAVTQNLFAAFSTPLRMTESSNAWVVAPAKSATGHALLASDPHLELTRLPQFWYAIGMHVADDSAGVVGVTAPGMPFFVMGHNGCAAWAFTSGGLDVTDFYPLVLNPEDSNQYGTADGWQDFVLIQDTLKIAGVDSVQVLTFKFTSDGPVIDDDEPSPNVNCLHWAGFDADLDKALTSAFSLSEVETFEQFRTIVTGLGALDANMMYADTAGNIGYQLSTPLPVRSDESDRWTGYYPIDETPHTLNPAQGWLASANNLPQRLPYIRGQFFANRIISISELLASQNIFTVADMQRFQMDTCDRYLLRFKDFAAATLDNVGEPEKATLMRSWDGSTSLASKETALINVFLTQLKRQTFFDELDSLAFSIPAKWIEHLDVVDSAGWFDNVHTADTVENLTIIAKAAMTEALRVVGDRDWGQLQSFQMQHPLAMIPIIGGWLDLSTELEPWNGTPGTLKASFYREIADDRFACVAGPSWRFVIDMGDVDAATMVLPAGNSGNPTSDHFLDFYPLYKSGERWNVPYHRDKVMENVVSTLTLTPASKP